LELYTRILYQKNNLFVFLIIYLFYQAVQCFHIFLRPFNNYIIFFLHFLLSFQSSSNNPFSIIIFINCNWVITRWQCLLYMSTNMKMVRTNIKMVNTKFKTGGLHEKHEVATWNLGNHLSICL